MSIDSEILASNPLALWKLDEGSGTIANNSATKNTPADYHIPNGTTGAFPANGSWQTDSPTGSGSCWQFTESGGSAAFELPSAPSYVAGIMTGNGKLTYEYWIKATNGVNWNTSSPYGGFFPISIYDGGNEGGGSDGVSVYCSVVMIQGGETGYWEFGDNGQYSSQSFTATGISDGNWHHMVHRFDKDDATGRTKIFMDGKLIFVSNARTTPLPITDQPMRIGARVGDPLLRGGNARMSRIAIYDNYALTDGGVSSPGMNAGGEVYSHFTGGAAINTAPTVGAVTIETATVYANTTPIQAKVASITDAEQSSATLTWRLKKGAATIQTITESGVALPVTDRTVNFSSFGTVAKGDSLTVELTADDLQGSNNTTVATSAAKVVANSAPTIAAGPTISPLSAGTNDTLTASYAAADVDTADTLTPTYLWEKQTGGAGPWTTVGGNGPTLNLSTAGNGDVGDKIRVTVTVSDGTASSAPATSAELAIGDSAPSWAAGTMINQTVQEGAVVSLTATATDTDGQAITFSLPSDPTGGAATLTPAAQVGNSRAVTLAWTVPANGAATPVRNFTVRATANGVDTDLSFTLTVANTAPVLAAVANQTVNRGSTLEVPISATDANGHDVNWADTTLCEYEQPPGNTPVAGLPAFVSVVTLTGTTAKLVISPPGSGGNVDYRLRLRFKDGI